MKKNQLTLSEAAKATGLHPKTLQRLDREGVFKAKRTCTNRRYYTYKDIETLRSKRAKVAKAQLAKEIVDAVGRYHARVES